MAYSQKVLNVLSSNRWYHGTTMDGYINIQKFGILVDYNMGHQLDFGFGFYLTPKPELAESYISRTNGWDEQDEKLVVMEYAFCPIEWEKNGECNIKVFPAFDDEFANFVFFNRTENVHGERQHSYDVIYGVMSDNYPTAQIIEYKAGMKSKEEVLSAFRKDNRMKQLSLHTQTLCDKIELIRAYRYDPATKSREELI